MSSESIIGQVMLGRIDQDLGLARIACTAAASRQISCQSCENILDERTTALITTTGRSTATDQVKTNLVCICTDCLDAIRPKLVKTAQDYDCTILIETWHDAETLDLGGGV